MALFGLFGKKSEGAPLKKHGERATNKRAQAIDRWESIQALIQIGSAEAVQALLPRFGFYVDPSITDQDEKDAAFAGIVAAGDCAIAPVEDYLKRAESIAWPLKMLDALCSTGDVVSRLVEILGDMDTEYERDPQRKIDMIVALEERRDPRVVNCVMRFLQDANETVRFSSVGTIFAQDEPEAALGALVECYLADESMRVRNRILEGLVELRAAIPDSQRGALRAALMPGFELDAKGILKRR